MLPFECFAATTFMEPGTDATQDFTFYLSTTGTVASVTDQAKTGPRSIKCSTSNPAVTAIATSPISILTDTGSQVSFWFRFDTLPAATSIMFALVNTTPTTSFAISILTNGTLQNIPTGGTAATGTTVLAVNTWYRICLSYFVTNTTTYAYKVYINGVLDSTTNAGTLTATGSDRLRLANQSLSGINRNFWFDDIYAATGGASSSSQPDTGDIRVTAKRPFSNGTVNGFTGSGTPSSYGTGNARYVNERPLSTTNFVSVVATGVTTEEYNIENRNIGDVVLQGQSIVDYAGWVYANALLAETGSIVVNNVTSNISLTSANTLFTAFAGSSVYPAGTGTDIGIITSALATTVTLNEAGMLFAYRPSNDVMFADIL